MNNKLNQYIKKTFKNVITIGLINHSYIIDYNGKNFVVYSFNKHNQTKFMVCHFDSRVETDNYEEIEEIIKKILK